MPISFGGKPKEDDVVSLIAAKKYARAIEVLKAQLRKKGANPSLRMQLADVLILAEKRNEAISLLLPLADQYANEGFAAKAVSVLKKVQKIDPGRRDVDSRLARLIEERQREAVVLPPARSGGAPGEAGLGGDEGADGGAVLEIGFSMAPISVSAPQPSPPVAKPAPAVVVEAAPAAVVEPAPVLAAEPLPVLEPEPAPVPLAEPLPALEAEPLPAPVVEPELPPVLEAEPVAPLEAEALPEVVAEPLPAGTAAPAEGGGIEDYDLLYAGESEEDEAPLVAEWVEEEPAQAMSAGQFADELMSLVDSVFQESQPAAPAAAEVAASPAPPRSGTQIVVSPLFRDFSVDEMVAVIEGLKLLSFERGDVILRQGQPGASLYMLTSGRVRAFRKDAAGGRQLPIGDLTEGAFFGEMSILSGAPRAASVVALTRCELLELDRPTLDGITTTHPRVWDVLREFAAQRMAALPRQSGG